MCQSQNKIDANVLKSRFTDMKLMRIWCNTNISIYILIGKKTAAFPVIVSSLLSCYYSVNGSREGTLPWMNGTSKL